METDKSLHQNLIIVFLAVLLSAPAVALAEADTTVYSASGVLEDGDQDRRELRIRHDEIENYMPAMTMPFPIRDWDALPGDLYTGDSIAFELVVLPGEYYIRAVEILKRNPLAPPKFEPTAKALHPGEIYPNGRFTDAYGEPFELAATEPALRFISFIFTRCPLPTMCPLVDRKHDMLADLFAKQKVGRDRLLFVSISFDYVVDTPELLHEHYGWRIEQGGGWTVLSSVGHEDDLRVLAAAAGVDFWGIEEDQVSHTMNSVLIDGEGKVVEVFSGSDWELQAAQESIRQALGEGP